MSNREPQANTLSCVIDNAMTDIKPTATTTQGKVSKLQTINSICNE